VKNGTVIAGHDSPAMIRTVHAIREKDALVMNAGADTTSGWSS